ncbi:hypothetical protein [Sorangium sp. So ce1182]|uniref:hypothetical protein n=1 Tax=Sorangium sp. So ce1182 TaxID=3133334 RepID=UPI003F5D6869
MLDDLSRDVQRLDRDLVTVRRDLHRHPELGYTEVRTSQIVAERLRKLGLTERTGVAGTGVIATSRASAPAAPRCCAPT